MSFVHLNTRSDYSFLLSTVTPEKLLQQALEYDIPGMALTDVGNLHGAIEFFSLAKKLPPLKNGARFNPMAGMTVIIAAVKWESVVRKFYKLVLLAETMEGYRNLCRLSTVSHNRKVPYEQGMDLVLCGKPYTTLDEVFKHCQGCIVLTAGAEGEVFEHVLHNRSHEAEDFLGMLKDGFGKDNVFIEIQNHNYEEEKQVNQKFLELAPKIGLPLVATNQVCYLLDTDQLSWNVFYSVGEKRTLTMKDQQIKADEINILPGTGYHLRSPQEMEIAFSNIPEALHNTMLIHERCRIDIIDTERHMPLFPLQGKTPEEYLREESHRRLQLRCPSAPVYRERLEYELSIIEKMNFASYFIIVADFIDFARKQGIMVGAGRGSAAGSLLSYVMGITSLDPIVYGLYFERFLNPERISFPDIDIDFQDDRRDEVIEYVRHHYGKDKVAQIVSFSKLKSKAVFKDVARVFGIDFETSNKISKLLKTRLTEWEEEKRAGASYLEFNYQHNLEFTSIINSNSVFKIIYEQALKLENLTRQTGIHAAGVVIADKPLVEYIPLMKAGDGGWVTQFDGGYLESYCGLLKIDFLGITTLTVLQRCVDEIKKIEGKVIDIDHPPLNDRKTFTVFSQGMTAGIFQFESEGMTAYLKDLMPEDLKELTAMNALYRPGPMAWIPVYIAKKHNRKPEFSNDKARNDFERLEAICKKHEGLNQILSETRGIPFYQEQIMEICKTYAGFTLGAADNVRKAMGKKDKPLIQKLREDFVTGAVAGGNSQADAEFLYSEIIIPFAGYGFNKSHSACYAYLAYQTAYLKAHYPICFMTSLFNSDLEKSDASKTIYKYLNECFLLSIEVYPPDINYSQSRFTAQRSHIVYGLAGIKNIGLSASNFIVEEREKNGPYRDPIDFLLRHTNDRIGKSTVEALIKAGCFDFTGYTSDRWLKVLEEIQDRLDQQRIQLHSGQLDLFAEHGIDSNEDIYERIKSLPTIRSESSRWEREALGFSLRYEPTLLYRQQITQATTLDLAQVHPGKDRGGYLGCVIREAVLFKDRNGKNMAKLIVSDGKKTYTVLGFAQRWEKILETFPEEVKGLEESALVAWLTDKPVRLKLWVRTNRTNPQQIDLILDNMDFLSEKTSVEIPKTVWITLCPNRTFDDKNLQGLKEIIESNPGPHPVRLVIKEEDRQNLLTLKKGVQASNNFKIAAAQIDIVENVKVLEEKMDGPSGV